MRLDFVEETYSACRVSPNLYVANPYYRRVNFYAQQVRAIALIEGVIASPDFDRNFCEIGIIGGGVTGVTCAAAAISRGLPVTLIEQDGDIMAKYADSSKELHPTIILWPFQKLNSYSNLPFLNWFAGPASVVAATIADQWEQYFRSRCNVVKRKVIKIEQSGRLFTLRCDDGTFLKHHILILCTGWERERYAVADNSGTIKDIDVPSSYWTDRDYDGSLVTISGIGDGGLADAAAQTYGLKAAAVGRYIAHLIDHKSEQKRRIAQAEMDSQVLYIDGDVKAAFRHLEDFYAAFSLDSDEQSKLNRLRKLKIPHVDLIYREDSPFSPLSSPINKIIVADIANRLGAVRFVSGSIYGIVEDGKLSVFLNSGGVSKPIDLSNIVIRHGAKPAAATLLTGAQISALSRVEPSVLNGIIPSDLKWRNYVKKSRMKDFPSHSIPKFRGAFIKWLNDHIRTLILNNLPIFSRNAKVSITPGLNERWEVAIDQAIPDDIKSLFPIVGRGFRVELADSLDFHAPR